MSLNDPAIRKVLVKQLLQQEPAPFVRSEVSITEHDGVVDVMAISREEMIGFEIKSDRDSLTRLEHQVRVFGHVFDRMTLVCGVRYRDKVAQHIPAWWGIQVAEQTGEQVELATLRPAELNPNVQPLKLLHMLHKTELVDALHVADTARGWRGRRKKDIIKRLMQVAPLDFLRWEVRVRVQARFDGAGRLM
jgi:hypothetical protein